MTYYCGNCDGRIAESGQANVFACVRCGTFYTPAQLERARDVSQGKGTGMPYISVPRVVPTTGEKKMEIRITDGTETTTIFARDVDAAIAGYARSYSFTEPGEVECRVLDEDGETTRTFVVRSEDGRTGRLAE